MTRSASEQLRHTPSPAGGHGGKRLIAVVALLGLLTAALTAHADAERAPVEGLTPHRAAPSGTQKVTIEIDDGFTPSSIWVKPGERTELTFVRKVGDGCGETILLPSLGVKRTLKPGRKTTVTFTPKSTQVVRFSCGMKMYKGHVAVIPDREQATLLARAVASGKGCCPE